jgi:hypothetical protein
MVCIQLPLPAPNCKIKLKLIRRKGVIQFRIEIIEIEIRKTTEKVNEIES